MTFLEQDFCFVLDCKKRLTRPGQKNNLQKQFLQTYLECTSTIQEGLIKFWGRFFLGLFMSDFFFAIILHERAQLGKQLPRQALRIS